MTRQLKTVTAQKKKRGPAPTGKGVQVVVRMQPDLLDWLDSERAKADDEPSRPEMVRRILVERERHDRKS